MNVQDTQTSPEEREELRRSVRRFLQEKSPMAATRDLMSSPTGTDSGVWSQMADQLGLQGICVPEEFGGAGYGPVELAIVTEELGRCLYVGPFFATVALAAQALVASEDATSQQRWLPGIVDGTTTATVAAGEGDDSWVCGPAAARAVDDGDGWALTGEKTYVVDGAEADLLLVFASTPTGLGLFGVQGDAAGVSRTSDLPLDLTRRLGRVRLDGAAGSRVDCDAEALCARLRDLAVVALAAEQVGGAQRCLETAVDYARLRVAFGRPIGSYEAIKHTCADMLIAVETARSIAGHAAEAARDAGAELPLAAAMAKSACSEAFLSVARDNIQVHGGIGFTWEHDAHLYLKRATADSAWLGTPTEHRRRLAEMPATWGAVPAMSSGRGAGS
jgi:alkylation response protein AidB-like acyl-CoA dehydrogenase